MIYTNISPVSSRVFIVFSPAFLLWWHAPLLHSVLLLAYYFPLNILILFDAVALGYDVDDIEHRESGHYSKSAESIGTVERGFRSQDKQDENSQVGERGNLAGHKRSLYRSS